MTTRIIDGEIILPATYPQEPEELNYPATKFIQRCQHCKYDITDLSSCYTSTQREGDKNISVTTCPNCRGVISISRCV